MTLLSTLFPLLCLSSGVHSFPALADTLDNIHGPWAAKLSASVSEAVNTALHRRLLVDPLTEPVDVTGSHAFVPPDFASGDQRGPCPGLNALANHNYIDHSGVTTLVESVAAMNEVFGMGVDLSTILAVMGTVFVGNPLSLNPGFSIGYESPESQNLLGNVLGLLGTPRGLNGSHNIIEGDSSNTRADLYMGGDASTLQLDLFQDFYDMSPGEGDYNMDLFAKRASLRFNETVSTNPNFYYGPFTGMIARNAGYLFAGRMFANYSQENITDGHLSKSTLRSIFAVEETNGTLVYNKGHERIPENWYRRPVDYGLVSLNLDLLDWILQYPQLASIGGNVGSVNSFVGVDLGNVTGGILNAGNLLQGNNLLCFVFEVLKTVSPNSLSTLYTIIEVPLQLLLDTLGSTLLSLTCPAFADLKVGGNTLEEVLTQTYPGANLTGNVL